MRPHALSLTLGLLMGLLISELIVGAPASAKKNPKAQAKVSCWDTASSQMELNECASLGAQETRAEMDKVLTAIAHAYRSEPLFLVRLRESQEAWLRWMHAEIEAHYPIDEDGSRWGSVRPMCQSGLASGMLRERTRELKTWLDPSDREEGELCGGMYQLHGRRAP